MTFVPPFSARGPGPLKAAGFSQVAPGGMVRRPPQNPLLVRDDIGRARPSCYDLPSEHFAFGRPGNMDPEGARDVSMRWVNHMPSDAPELHVDFVFSNKKAASSKITTAREQKFFRREFEAASMVSPRGGGGHHRGPQEPSQRGQDIVHGRKVRPSTPIRDVMSNRFAEQNERELSDFYTGYHDAKEQSQLAMRKIRLTAASRGHATMGRKAKEQHEEPKELFKLSRFRRVSPKISNGRQRNLSEHLQAWEEDFGEREAEIFARLANNVTPEDEAMLVDFAH